VLAVDGEGRIVSLNPAGARMLKLDAGRARGRPVQEAVRNTALQDLVAAALARQGPVEGEITLHEGEARNVQVRGVPLGDPGGSRTGALLVLDDVTHLRRLERVRQDFVANVTHELRTPITSIQAAAETLTEGECAEEEAERFLAIIARQTRRLNAIIDDLLQLSRIEAEADGGRISLEEHPLDLVLTGAVQACAARAAERQISIELHCDPSLRARIDAALIENAVVNLIDNAIKYSDERTRVRVSASEGGDAVVIEVVDRGWGIDPRHHDRIFERFYVVDRGRSRSVGGTGLGLAIVRHIVLAHGGRVELESAPGEGSTFRLVLPRN
jgi:two-component system phosphate regulon sensor histidine kinase PhoR